MLASPGGAEAPHPGDPAGRIRFAGRDLGAGAAAGAALGAVVRRRQSTALRASAFACLPLPAFSACLTRVTNQAAQDTGGCLEAGTEGSQCFLPPFCQARGDIPQSCERFQSHTSARVTDAPKARPSSGLGMLLLLLKCDTRRHNGLPQHPSGLQRLPCEPSPCCPVQAPRGSCPALE